MIENKKDQTETQKGVAKKRSSKNDVKKFESGNKSEAVSEVNKKIENKGVKGLKSSLMLFIESISSFAYTKDKIQKKMKQKKSYNYLDGYKGKNSNYLEDIKKLIDRSNKSFFRANYIDMSFPTITKNTKKVTEISRYNYKIETLVVSGYVTKLNNLLKNIKNIYQKYDFTDKKITKKEAIQGLNELYDSINIFFEEWIGIPMYDTNKLTSISEKEYNKSFLESEDIKFINGNISDFKTVYKVSELLHSLVYIFYIFYIFNNYGKYHVGEDHLKMFTNLHRNLGYFIKLGDKEGNEMSFYKDGKNNFTSLYDDQRISNISLNDINNYNLSVLEGDKVEYLRDKESGIETMFSILSYKISTLFMENLPLKEIKNNKISLTQNDLLNTFYTEIINILEDVVEDDKYLKYKNNMYKAIFRKEKVDIDKIKSKLTDKCLENIKNNNEDKIFDGGEIKTVAKTKKTEGDNNDFTTIFVNEFFKYLVNMEKVSIYDNEIKIEKYIKDAIIKELTEEMKEMYRQQINSKTIENELKYKSYVTLLNDYMNFAGLSEFYRVYKVINTSSDNNKLDFPLNFLEYNKVGLVGISNEKIDEIVNKIYKDKPLNNEEFSDLIINKNGYEVSYNVKEENITNDKKIFDYVFTIKNKSTNKKVNLDYKILPTIVDKEDPIKVVSEDEMDKENINNLEKEKKNLLNILESEKGQNRLRTINEYLKEKIKSNKEFLIYVNLPGYEDKNYKLVNSYIRNEIVYNSFIVYNLLNFYMLVNNNENYQKEFGKFINDLIKAISNTSKDLHKNFDYLYEVVNFFDYYMNRENGYTYLKTFYRYYYNGIVIKYILPSIIKEKHIEYSINKIGKKNNKSKKVIEKMKG